MPSERIIGIKKIGTIPTMDIEVDNNSHIFYGNNIATSNSHAVGYGILGYYTAYAKAHECLSFFCSYLQNAKEKQKPKIEIAELVAEAKLMGVEVSPPTLRQLKEKFYIEQGRVVFGISDIKGIGPSSYKKLAGKVKIEDGFSWWDSIKQLSVVAGQGIVESLIKAGALDFTKVTRNEMLYEVDILFSYKKNLKEGFAEFLELYSGNSLLETLKRYMESLGNELKTNVKKDGGERANLRKKYQKVEGDVKILENPPVKFFDIPAWLAYNETIMLGTSITCSAIDGCDTDNANATCKEFFDGRNDFMVFAVELERVKVVKVKKTDKEMAFLTIKDNSCSLSDVCVFADVYEEFKELLFEGNKVLIHGEKDKKKSSMIVKSVAQLGQLNG